MKTNSKMCSKMCGNMSSNYILNLDYILNSYNILYMDAETCRGIPKGQLFTEMHYNMGLILQIKVLHGVIGDIKLFPWSQYDY